MDKKKSKRFKKAIKSTGLSHEELATQLGVKVHDIRNMSAGRKLITSDFALDLEKEFGINPIWLIFGRGDMVSENIDNNGIENLMLEAKTVDSGTIKFELPYLRYDSGDDIYWYKDIALSEIKVIRTK